MEGKKISGLTPKNLSASDLLANKMFVPIINNENSSFLNYKMDIVSIYNTIRAKIMEDVLEILSNVLTGQDEESSPSDPAQYNSLVNRIVALENKLNDASNWPTNYIGIKDINTEEIIYYGLPSGPGLTGYPKNEIIITLSDVRLPDMYCTIAILNPIDVENDYYKVAVRFTPSTLKDTLNLNGGTIHELYVYGTINTSSGSSDIDATMSFGDNGITFAGSTLTFNPLYYTINIGTNYNTNVTINDIKIKVRIGVKINNVMQYVEVPGTAVYYTYGNQGITQSGYGYITLPTDGSEV